MFFWLVDVGARRGTRLFTTASQEDTMLDHYYKHPTIMARLRTGLLGD